MEIGDLEVGKKYIRVNKFVGTLVLFKRDKEVAYFKIDQPHPLAEHEGLCGFTTEVVIGGLEILEE